VGSFGVVRLAKNIKDDKHYAIKIIDISSLCASEIKGVEREIRTHLELEHPRVVKLFDSFTESNSIHMVMEWA
jgi:serine/threonine protein kinase